MSSNKINNKKYEIESGKIKKDTIISLISDIHWHGLKSYSLIRGVADNIGESNPNFIAIPGDIIEDSNLSKCEHHYTVKMIEEFSKIAPVIISLGNHDYMTKNNEGEWEYKFNDYLMSDISSLKDVHLLDNYVVDFDDTGISFSGHTFPFSYYEKDKESMANYIKYLKLIGFKSVQNLMNDDNFRCSLVHSPINLLNKKIIGNTDVVEPVDLFLSGHMHGGGVPTFLEKFTSTKGIISPHKKPFPSHVRGLIECGENTNAIVSTGIGKTDVDFINKFCKPEVNSVYIKKI